MRLNHRPIARAVAPVLLFAAGGCASTMTTGSTPDVETLTSVSRAIEGMGQFPAAGDMSPDVELVTFAYADRQQEEPRRDTIRSPGAVAEWLQELHAAQLPDIEFLFSTREVFLCDGAAVQQGTYDVRAGGRYGRPVRQPFIARWLPDGSGGWLLEGLWLQPDGAVRTATLAAGCASVRMAEIAARRFVVTLEGATTSDPFAPAFEQAMRDVGWTHTSPVTGAYPRAHSDRLALSASLSYRLTPGFLVSGLYSRLPSSTTDGNSEFIGRTTIRTDNQSLMALLLARKIGMIAIGLGPSVTTVDFHWSHRPSRDPEPPLSESHSVIGLLTRLSASVPVTPWLEFSASARYGFFPEVQTPPYLELEAFPFRPTRGALSIGAGGRF